MRLIRLVVCVAAICVPAGAFALQAGPASSASAAAAAELPDAPGLRGAPAPVLVADLSLPPASSAGARQASPQQQTPPAPQTAPAQQQVTPPQQPVPPPPPPQQTTPPPSAQTPAERHAEAERELQEEERQRMLGVIPNFNTVMSGEAAPINAREKFHLFFKSSVDPFQFVAAGVDAGIEQAQDEYPAYGQGFAGYAKRYGASFADGFDGNLWGNAILPSLLRQDPRYFRLGHGRVGRRIWYAVISNVRCKGDNGKWQPNYSNVLGNFIGGAISNVYYPSADRGAGLTIERGFTVTAEGAIGSLAVEFYPDVIGYFRRRHAAHAAQTP